VHRRIDVVSAAAEQIVRAAVPVSSDIPAARQAQQAQLKSVARRFAVEAPAVEAQVPAASESRLAAVPPR